MTPGSDKKLIVPPQPGKEQNSGKSHRGNVLNRGCVGRWGVGSQVCLQLPVSLLWSFTIPSPLKTEMSSMGQQKEILLES